MPRRFLLLLLLALAGACTPTPPTPPPPEDPPASEPPAAKAAFLPAEQFQRDLHDACTYCHAFSQPETVPRGLWEKELKLAYGFLADSDFNPDRVPPFEQALQYFQDAAPVRYPPPEFSVTPSPLRFEPEHLETWVTHHGATHVSVAGNLINGRLTCIVSDMRNSKVFACFPDEPDGAAVTIAAGGRPCRTEPADLDGDGRMDLLVADLGTLQASDDRQGRVVWLQATAEGKFRRRILLEGLGRVADVRAADFDEDGDLDLVVSVFGWRETGELLYAENQSASPDDPRFQTRVLDARNGAIHTPIADLNGDGLPDFVALFSQHHEQVVAFLNQGGGEFQQQTIFDFENPGFGSTGIELVDMDQDGDLDVLMSNGDTLDFEIHRPYHGVRWLENPGREFPFAHHPLIALPGAMSAAAGDLDGDGDLDVAAVSLLPFGLIDPETQQNILAAGERTEGLLQTPSLVWLERVGPGEFQTHVLESNLPAHASIQCVDVDDDGDLDLVTGYFTLEGVTNRALYLTPFPGAVTIWKNQGAP